MKKIVFFAAAAAMLLCVSCREDHTTPVNEIAKACFAPGGDGSFWEYFDARAQGDDRNFTVKVTDYEATQTPCEDKHAFSEYISYKLGGRECKVYSPSCTEDGTAQISFSIPHCDAPIALTCDAAGHFDCDSTCFMESYDVLENTYQKVHYFGIRQGSDYYHCFFAEGVGLIYMNDMKQQVQLKLTSHEIR